MAAGYSPGHSGLVSVRGRRLGTSGRVAASELHLGEMMGWPAVIGPESSPSSQQRPSEGCQHEHPSHAHRRDDHRPTWADLCSGVVDADGLLAELDEKSVSHKESCQVWKGNTGIFTAKASGEDAFHATQFQYTIRFFCSRL